MHFQMHFLGPKYAFLGPGAVTQTDLIKVGFRVQALDILGLG